jgi:hypothetical protein
MEGRWSLTLTTEEVNGHMDQIRTAAVEVLGVELR